MLKFIQKSWREVNKNNPKLLSSELNDFLLFNFYFIDRYLKINNNIQAIRKQKSSRFFWSY